MSLASAVSKVGSMQENKTNLPGIDILNTGYGDFELRFDPDSPADVQKAKETITDMLKRGYAIFVEHNGKTQRVRKFDPARTKGAPRGGCGIPWRVAVATSSEVESCAALMD